MIIIIMPHGAIFYQIRIHFHANILGVVYFTIFGKTRNFTNLIEKLECKIPQFGPILIYPWDRRGLSYFDVIYQKERCWWSLFSKIRKHLHLSDSDLSIFIFQIPIFRSSSCPTPWPIGPTFGSYILHIKSRSHKMLDHHFHDSHLFSKIPEGWAR